MSDIENSTEPVSETVADTEKSTVTVEVKSTSKKAKKASEEKPGFFARVKEKLKKFWKNYKSELKKITWYSRRQTLYSTLLVLVCIIVAATFVGILDFGFSKAIEGLGSLV